MEMEKNQYPLSCFPWYSGGTLKTSRTLQETMPMAELNQTRQGLCKRRVVGKGGYQIDLVGTPVVQNRHRHLSVQELLEVPV